jgi:hypothetical protein
MGHSQAAAGIDRLPWLPDEPARTARGGRRELMASVAAAIIIVAAGSYWIGMRSGTQQRASQAAAQHSGTTVALPEPRAVEPRQPQVIFEPAREVSPPAARDVPLSAPRTEQRAFARPAPSPPTDKATTAPAKPAAAQKSASQPAKVVADPDSKPLTAWPAWKSQGAKGRIVRNGAFGSRQQAKLGWRHMVTAYPAFGHLKATVVADRNSRGRRFYRFQIGTTSQAHSEVLCQRVEKIRMSCAVVGLALDPKGVER